MRKFEAWFLAAGARDFLCIEAANAAACRRTRACHRIGKKFSSPAVDAVISPTFTASRKISFLRMNTSRNPRWRVHAAVSSRWSRNIAFLTRKTLGNSSATARAGPSSTCWIGVPGGGSANFSTEPIEEVQRTTEFVVRTNPANSARRSLCAGTFDPKMGATRLSTNWRANSIENRGDQARAGAVRLAGEDAAVLRLGRAFRRSDRKANHHASARNADTLRLERARDLQISSYGRRVSRFEWTWLRIARLP